MAVTVRRRWALGLLAVGVLVAGCSNHSGLTRHRPSGAPTSPAAAPLISALAAPSVPSVPSVPPHSRSASPTPTTGSTPAAAGTSRGVERHRSSGAPVRRRPSSATTATGSSPARAAVTVSPSRRLHDGQTVTVTGAHLTPGERVDVRECRVDLSSCAGFAGTPATVSGRGSFSTSLAVSRSIWLTDCGTSGCAVRVLRANGAVLLAPIGFG